MSIDQKTWNSLKTMGLTDYEATTYLALTSMISGTATEISMASKVPRSRVYDILKAMARKGFVEIERGRPLKYNVVPPAEVFIEISRNYWRIWKKLNWISPAPMKAKFPNYQHPYGLFMGLKKLFAKKWKL